MTIMPEYRLQALYDMRQKAKKNAEDNYAKAQKVVQEEGKKLKDLQDKLVSMKEFRQAKRLEYADNAQTGKLSVEMIQTQRRHIDRLENDEKVMAENIEKQKAVCEEVKKKADEALQKMMKATQEFKALEKNKEKWLAKVKKDLAQKEEDASEDISQAQYFKLSKESEQG